MATGLPRSYLPLWLPGLGWGIRTPVISWYFFQDNRQLAYIIPDYLEAFLSLYYIVDKAYLDIDWLHDYDQQLIFLVYRILRNDLEGDQILLEICRTLILTL